MKRMIAIPSLILVCAVSASAQLLQVKVIDRQDKEDSYDYAAVYNNVAVGKTFKVHGATFTLELPDGRLAIVNCDSKFAEHMAGAAGNHRSCRMPLVDTLQVDFKGDNAKLIWSVSIDGKKMQSETYKILGVLDKPKTPPQTTAKEVHPGWKPNYRIEIPMAIIDSNGNVQVASGIKQPDGTTATDFGCWNILTKHFGDDPLHS
jgi:hypothetical protein